MSKGKELNVKWKVVEGLTTLTFKFYIVDDLVPKVKYGYHQTTKNVMMSRSGNQMTMSVT